MSSKLHAIKSIALVLSIIIVLNLFFNFGVRTFYPPPQHEEFCPQQKLAERYQNRAACEEIGGLWSPSLDGRVPYPVTVEDKNQPLGFCDVFYTCNKEFRITQDLYNRNVFIVLIVAGIVVLVAGAFINAAAAVSSGFVLGGVVSLLVGTLRYWSGMQDYLRFIILGLMLSALIWIGYRKLKR